MQELLAPMAANVWKIDCKEGDTVAADDVLIVMEAMKMEVETYAPASGVIAKIAVSEGQAVEEGQLLLQITPA